MKKTIYFILASLFAVNIQAQVIDNEGLQTFINELKALKGEHVECENENFTPNAYLEFPENFVNFKLRDQDIQLTGITTSDSTFCYLFSSSIDNIGYNLIQNILYKYYDEESEDIFGIPLLACNRVDGNEQIMYMNEKNTLLIRDNGHDEILVLYVGFNLMNSIKRMLQSFLEVNDEEYVNVEIFGGMDFNVHVTDAAKFSKNSRSVYMPSADSDEIIAFVKKIYEDNILNIESLLANAKSAEKQEELAISLTELKEEQEEHLADLEKELEELDVPSFIEIIPGSNEYYVAIPQVPAHLKEKQKPYAAKGIYDWINNYYSFRAGAKMGNIVSYIITPQDVVMEYVIRNYPRDRWLDDGFTPEYKEITTVEYQGSMPAVLYSFSDTEKGYNDLLRDFDDFFNHKLGDKVWGLEVIQCSENNGKRFVQLWGEGSILMCIYDSPADKYFHMSIIIGGVSGFEQAVNEYYFAGEKDWAKRCNIVIDSDLSNKSYGIHFTTDEYFYAGKQHKNGVHIDFGYIRKFTK